MTLKLIRRMETTNLHILIVTISAVITSLLLFSLLFLYEGINPLNGYYTIFDFAFSPNKALFELTLPRTIPLFLLTLAFIVPKKAGIWNIGAEGQFYMGAIAATGTFLAFSSQPPHVLIPLMIIAAAGFGAGWALIVGFLKGKLNTNEIVVTLMLNLIAVLIVTHLVAGGPWMSMAGRPESELISASGIMPCIGDTRVPYTIVLAIILAVLLFIVLKKSKLGYWISTVGENPLVAKYSGMSFLKVALVTTLIAGMLAGIAGYHQVANGIGKLIPNLQPGWGFYGIVIGLLVNLNIIAAMIGSFLIMGLLVGTKSLEMFLGMAYGAGDIFIGMVFLVFVAFQFFLNYRITWKRGGG